MCSEQRRKFGTSGHAVSSVLLVSLGIACADSPGERHADRLATLMVNLDSVTAVALRDSSGEPVAIDHGHRVAIQSNGNVVIPELYESRVVLFDSTGKMLAVAGRKGSGPGEFQNRAGLVRLNGDSIGVHDVILQRLNIFDPQLTFVRSGSVMLPANVQGFSTVVGQFADGSLVAFSRSMAGHGAPDGVSKAHHTMVVLRPDGSFRQLDLPAFTQVSVTLGNNSMNTRVPESDTRSTAVCERGIVVVANNTIVVYDTALAVRFTPAFLGHADTITRTPAAAVKYSEPRENPELDAKFEAAVDAAQPKTQVRYARVIVSADGYLWHGLGGNLDGRYVRTTASGAIIDTVLAPFHVMHADGDATIAIGVRRDDQDMSPSIFRPRVKSKASRSVPASELGRCNATVPW